MTTIPQGWEVKAVDKISKTFAGGTPDRGIEAYYKGHIPWVKSGEVNQTKIYDTEEKITDEAIKNSSAKLIKKNTILVAMYGATAGQIAHLKIDACSNQAVLAVPVEKDCNDFVFYALSYAMPKLLFHAQGSGQPNLSKQLVDKTLLQIPPLFEQQKIAEILSGIDRAIEATQTLINKEKMIKKGLMVDLLNHGIDEQGRVRTPQTHGYIESPLGMIPEGWEVKFLGELGEFKNGINKSKEDFGFGVPFVNLQDIFGKWLISSNNFDLVNADENEIKNYNLLSGDVLFVRSSVKASGVGLTSLVREDLYSTVYSGFIIRFRSKPNVYATAYKQYCFHEELFRQRLLQKATVSANSNINQESLASLLVSLPSIPEQERIATILSAQDRKIETEEANLAKLQHLKKGLMADLLSGKVRVQG